MFKNPYKKIKIFALVFFVFVTVICIALGILLLLNGRSEGILLMILLPLYAYITSVIFYAFGQIAEDTNEIKDLMMENNYLLNKLNYKNNENLNNKDYKE